MAVTKEEKKGTIQKFKIHDGDTGSPDVQIAILTQRISSLTEHLKIHSKDHSSRRGLLAMVNKRAKLLKYVKKSSFDKYVGLCESLGIRH
ncbi:MAG: 30S ribosomal protein S15 [Planctomycetes bacterium]|nr:30S ribosomal protein S15 [Planctomycetota bacterium]